jgi:hypothetical protein
MIAFNPDVKPWKHFVAINKAFPQILPVCQAYNNTIISISSNNKSIKYKRFILLPWNDHQDRPITKAPDLHLPSVPTPADLHRQLGTISKSSDNPKI